MCRTVDQNDPHGRLRCLVAARAGFTLVELLLVTVLLLLIMSAVVLNFEAVGASADFDEGLDRLQTLIRFARAEATITGRTVRLEFVPDRDPATWPPAVRVRLVRESEDLPGRFVDISGARAKQLASLEVDRLLSIETVRRLGLRPLSVNESIDLAGAGDDADRLHAIDATFDGMDGNGTALESLSFYPDGSAEDVEIEVAARDPDDRRRAIVRVSGVTGHVVSEVRQIYAGSIDFGSAIDARAGEGL